jgi:hypothetical protein
MAYEMNLLHCEIFWQWDSGLDFEQLNFSQAATKLQSEALVLPISSPTWLRINARPIIHTNDRIIPDM